MHLFEVNHNWLIEMIFGRQMIDSTETQDHLHKGQWGLHPDCSAHDALMHKILSDKVTRLTRTSFTTFDNDSKSCYDRIVMIFALILCQKHGVP